MSIDNAAKINALFESLGVSTQQDPYSGLIAENVAEGVVKIFDDYASGSYKAEKVIALLKAESSVTLADELNNVWHVIADAEI